MKKLWCLAVASIIAVSACASLSACGDLFEGPYKKGEEYINWDVDLSQPIKLKGYFPDSGVKNFGNPKKDDTAEIIEEKTGYEVEVYEQKGSGMEGEVKNILEHPKDKNSQYNFMKLNDACYTPYLERGAFLDLKRLLEETPEGKVLYQLVDMMDSGWESVKYTDSEGVEHIYGIPDFGYVHMTDSALIWNVAHLRQIGFEEHFGHELPETLSEADWAFYHLQETFKSKSGYRVLGVPGAASAEVNPIAGCFEVPYNFYVDEDGNIQIKNKSQNMYDYVDYMNRLYRDHILSEAWNTVNAGTIEQNFGDELHSVVYLTYWEVTNLVNNIKSKESFVAHYNEQFPEAQISNIAPEIRTNAIKWTTRLRGDGFSFENAQNETVTCKDQTTSKLIGNDGGVSYYTVIPAHMPESARYVIDYLAKKMEIFADFFGGNGLLLEDQEAYGNDPENFPTDTHWYEIPTPAGAPDPEDYKETEEIDAKYTAFEDFDEGIAFLRPMKYTYKDTRLKANGGNSENGEEVTVEVNEPGRWVKVTQRYIDYIANNSQYCTGTQAIAARVYCHLHELGFKAWYYCNYFTDEESWIPNPLAMSPVFKLWGPVNINARSHFLTGVESAICEKEGKTKSMLDSFMKEAIEGKTVGKDTVVYWSDAMSEEMTAWYNSHKPKN